MAVGSCAGTSWHGLHYNLVSWIWIRKKNNNNKPCTFLTGMVTKGPECWWLGFPKAFSNFLLYSQSLLEERLIAWRMLLSFECFWDETTGICDPLRSRARSGQSQGQTQCLESVVFLFVISQLWQKAILNLEVGNTLSVSCCWRFKEPSLNMEPHLRGLSRQFLRWDVSPGSTLKRKYLKKWHINAATCQVMKQFPYFQIPEYLLLPRLDVEMED